MQTSFAHFRRALQAPLACVALLLAGCATLPAPTAELDAARQALASGGFAPAEILALVKDPEVKAALKTNTDEALARGVFGAPTMFVGGEMFFGQDRLDFVREALA